jgi:hypothetical protein
LTIQRLNQSKDSLKKYAWRTVLDFLLKEDAFGHTIANSMPFLGDGDLNQTGHAQIRQAQAEQAQAEQAQAEQAQAEQAQAGQTRIRRTQAGRAQARRAQARRRPSFQTCVTSGTPGR